MSKQSGGSELMFFIVMIIFMAFLADQVQHRNDYNNSKAHQILQQYGISQKVSEFEYKMNN